VNGRATLQALRPGRCASRRACRGATARPAWEAACALTDCWQTTLETLARWKDGDGAAAAGATDDDATRLRLALLEDRSNPCLARQVVGARLGKSNDRADMARWRSRHASAPSVHPPVSDEGGLSHSSQARVRAAVDARKSSTTVM
jgi:hypothetical protein